MYYDDVNVAKQIVKANGLKDIGNEKFKEKDFNGAVEVYTKGMDTLHKIDSGCSEKMRLLVTLRSNRGSCWLSMCSNKDLSAETVSRFALNCIEDSTAVLDLPQDASSSLLVKNRLKRAKALCFMARSSKDVAERLMVAKADVAYVLEESAASTEAQKSEARDLTREVDVILKLHGAKLVDCSSIRGLFLSFEQIQSSGQNHCGPGFAMSREYMDKPGKSKYSRSFCLFVDLLYCMPVSSIFHVKTVKSLTTMRRPREYVRRFPQTRGICHFLPLEACTIKTSFLALLSFSISLSLSGRAIPRLS